LCESYDCTEVGSAAAALTLLREEHFTLVLSNILMTGISGLELVPHVRQLSPETVIVMISGEQTIESAIGALRAVVDVLPREIRQIWIPSLRPAQIPSSLPAYRRRADPDRIIIFRPIPPAPASV
jgi:CheY-like chemotaxis protein